MRASSRPAHARSRSPRSAAAGLCLLGLATACSTFDWGPGPEAQWPLRRFRPEPLQPAELPPFAAPPVDEDDVVDDYHGTTVADPYRWLEEPDGDRTRAFVAAQNTQSRAFLEALPERDALHERLRELWNFPRTSAPDRFGDRWFWSHNDGLQNQAVWLCDDAVDGPGRVLLDPNRWSEDGTVALAGFEPSHDGRRVAFATATSGSDWQEWQVLDVVTGETLPDRVPWAKFTRAAWTHDGRGFFYQRFPAPERGQLHAAANGNAQLCYHELGTDAASDRVVYERPDHPDWLFGAEVSDDGRFLVLTIRAGSASKTRIATADLRVEGWPVQPLRMAGDALWSYVGNHGDEFWLRTDFEAPNGRLLAVDRQAPDEEPRPIVAERSVALQSVRRFGGRFLCNWLVDATNQLTVHGDDGAELRQLPLPGLGSVQTLLGRPDDRFCYATFQSYLHAPTVLRHDVVDGTTTTFRASAFAGDASPYVTEQKALLARDGTRLLLFVTHRRDLVADGTNPTWLSGYGGFAAAMTPQFAVDQFAFVERGGVLAHAILRGGGEFGEAWHQAGMRERKQNVFDDFVACADYLVRNRYTCPARLAIGGRSNGGLLVGAMLTQHPDKFAAAIPEVGVLDMLRFHRFTIGRAWVPEYGCSDDAAAFRWLHAYSPLHQIRAGGRYPATLVMTGDHDDRVLPGHSYKFAAALQAAQAGPAPILLRIDTSSGHGAGKPTGKRLDEAADRLAFLAATIGG